MSMIIPVFGFSIGLTVSIIVYLDGNHYDLPQQLRLLFASIIGSVSFCGFIFSYRNDRALLYFYLQNIKPISSLTSPFEGLIVLLVTGMAVTSVSILSYVIITRRKYFD